MAGQRSAAGRVVRRPGDLARRGAELELVPPPLGGDHGHGRRADGTGLPCGPVRSAPSDLEEHDAYRFDHVQGVALAVVPTRRKLRRWTLERLTVREIGRAHV